MTCIELVVMQSYQVFQCHAQGISIFLSYTTQICPSAINFAMCLRESVVLYTEASVFPLCSSPIRSPVVDNEIIMMNTLYKERFPKVGLWDSSSPHLPRSQYKVHSLII